MRRWLWLPLLAWAATAQAFDWPRDLRGWWLTPDQQGQRLFEEGRYLEAAERFEDPWRRGAAYYRGGDFERAAGVFGRLRTAEAAFNRGNALVMLGQYDAAIESYQRALEVRPKWLRAEDNLALARARKQMLAPPESDSGGTGGMLGADEIVFDDSGRVDRSGSETVTEGGESLSEEEMRAIWLRRVENDPGDFLRARFAWQLHRRAQEEGDEPAAD
jgi:Ca-activated chloride channel family protein